MKVTQKEPNHSKKENLPSNTLENINSESKKIRYYQMKAFEPEGLCQKLAYMLIRPPKFQYNPNIIHPKRHLFDKFEMQIHRIPFELTVYIPKKEKMRYMILYLHGNGSSRVEGFMNLHNLPDGVGLACFDFGGCGNRSDQQFITLGKKQSTEVDIAARFLKNEGYQVVGWGRSMGAVSLLLSEQIDVMILDSPYSALEDVCKQKSQVFLPKACCCFFHCLYPCVFQCIRCKVQGMSEMDISEMNITEKVKKMNLQKKKKLCFVHGEEDMLILPYHSQRLYKSYQGPKKLLIFQGTHNSNRPEQVNDKCLQFVEIVLFSDEMGDKITEKDKKENIVQVKQSKSQMIEMKPLPPIQKNEQPSIILKYQKENNINQNDTSLQQSKNYLIKKQTLQSQPTSPHLKKVKLNPIKSPSFSLAFKEQKQVKVYFKTVKEGFERNYFEDNEDDGQKVQLVKVQMSDKESVNLDVQNQKKSSK